MVPEGAEGAEDVEGASQGTTTGPALGRGSLQPAGAAPPPGILESLETRVVAVPAGDTLAPARAAVETCVHDPASDSALTHVLTHETLVAAVSIPARHPHVVHSLVTEPAL